MIARRTPLDVIEIPQPCPADWHAMHGDDRQRFCDGCRKSVYNLSAMPRDEAERLVCASAGTLCVRFTRDARGMVRTLDYDRVSPSGHGWRLWTAIGTGAAVVVALVTGLVTGRQIPGTTVMGEPPPTMGAPPAWIAPATMPAIATTQPVESEDGGDRAEPALVEDSK